MARIVPGKKRVRRHRLEVNGAEVEIEIHYHLEKYRMPPIKGMPGEVDFRVDDWTIRHVESGEVLGTKKDGILSVSE